MAIEVSTHQFAGRNFIGFDVKSNQYWRTEMGNFGGIMRETSSDGMNFSGKDAMGGESGPAQSVLKIEADGSWTDTENFTRTGTQRTVKLPCTR
jgi:hypothetical protein